MSTFSVQATTLLAASRTTEAQATTNASGPIQAMRWNTAQKADSFYWTHIEQAVKDGTLSPEKPLAIGFEDTCLLNFGIAPDLIETDMTYTAALEKSLPPPAIPILSPQQELNKNRAMGYMEMNYSELHASNGVYNMEPWLQDMYRDTLDIDLREGILERQRLLQRDLKNIPAQLLALGIPANLVTEILQSMRHFQHIRKQSQAREQRKTSVLHARGYANIMGRIEATLDRAEAHTRFSSTEEGQSALRRLFDCWKETIFASQDLQTQMSSMDQSAEHKSTDTLTQFLHAVRETLLRCADDAVIPQCSLLSARDALHICPRQVVEDHLEALLVHDIVGQPDLAAERLETRKYGPLCALILPGSGHARYSLALREFQRKRLQESDKDRREFDLNRRATYPLNYIVFPNLTPPEEALEHMADAFLEYKAIACPAAYQNFITETRHRFPVIYEPSPEISGGKNITRKCAARYLAGFVMWAKYGRSFDLPKIESFIEWGRARLRRPDYLIPPRYRCVLDDFSDASPNRREMIFRRHMDDRFTCEQLRVALAIIRQQPKAAVAATAFLPRAYQENKYLKRAEEEAGNKSLQIQQRVRENLERFAFSNPEMKRLFLSTEAQFNGEVDLVRTQAAEKLGKDISFKDAANGIGARHEKALRQRLEEANRRIDQDLIGLLYYSEENTTASICELEQYLHRLEHQRETRQQRPPRYDGSSLRLLLGDRASRSETKNKENEKPIYEDDFVYYNLGALALRSGNVRSASDYFSRFCIWAAQNHWHLFGIYARERNATIEKKLKGKPA